MMKLWYKLTAKRRVARGLARLREQQRKQRVL